MNNYSQSCFRDKLNKTIQAYRILSPALFFKKASKSIIHRIFETNSAIWYERDLSAHIDSGPSVISLQTVNVSKNEFEKWATHFFYSGRPTGKKLLKELETAIKNNHVYLCGKINGEIVGYVKVGLNNVYVHDYKMIVRIPQNIALIYDTYVSERFRNSGLASFLINYSTLSMRQKGCEYVRCHIPSWNIASIKAYEKCGFYRKKYIRYYRITGQSFFTSNPETL